MKRSLLILACSGCLLTGCQSANTNPMSWARNPFRPKSTHSFDQTAEASRVIPAAKPTGTGDAFAKGEADLKNGNYKSARKHFLEVVQADPENGAAHHRLGYIGDKQKDYQAAEIHYLAALRLEPDDANIACDLGYSYLLQNRTKDSRRFLEKALKIDPNHQASLLNLAGILAKEGDYDGALALFRQAGPEEEAQANIARLFPKGRPAGADQMQLASNNRPQEGSGNRDGQQSFQQLPVAQNPTTPRKKLPNDISQLDPREIPADQINNVFAQIDAEFEQQRMQQQSRPQQKPAPTQQAAAMPNVAQNMPSYQGQTRQTSSVPGHLPMQSPQQVAQNQPGSTPQNPADQLPQSPYMQQMPQTTPIASQPATPPAQQPQTPDPYDDYAIVGLTPNTETSTAQQTQAAVPTPPEMNTLPATRMPVGGAPQLTSSSLPGHPPVNTVPYNPAGRGSAASSPQQDVMSMALQMGMNAGPGQMFPVQTTSGAQSGTSVAMPGSQRPQIETEPITTPLAEATSPSMPAMNAPQMPPVQYGLHQQNPIADPSGTGVQQVNGQQGNNVQAASGTAIRDWPHTQTPATPTLNMPQNGQNAPSPSNTPASNGNTPWLDSSSQPNGDIWGQTTPQIEPAGNTPQQWPHSPQAHNGSNTSEVVVHRRATPPSTVPTNPSSQNAPANQPLPMSSLPEVVPQYR
ncbi:tetratricopeptide repeat protein [Rubinisphaera margarita]|uniref:tetratricopeptide repeat protein n=1 Tax=Rubinisphaera margarita TaxID=2909586 RepID=UPI001EE8298F|nr:tetratricopeptide repeat protein [Rubinisphaera margarita]MCG6155397.1 tetratricopeptide repeat protein [Rubinisphaera margarita]